MECGEGVFMRMRGRGVALAHASLRYCGGDTRTLGQWGTANDGPGGLANILVLLFY